MSIKKKLGMGVATAALGLTLVGGGTYAYFNDVDTLNNAFAAGTLNVSLDEVGTGNPINFDLSNMKPGDSVERWIGVTNRGSLAIKEVLMTATADAADFVDGAGEKDADPAALQAFLEQFKVEVFNTDQEFSVHQSILDPVSDLTLWELVNGDYEDLQSKFLSTDNTNPNSAGKINVAPLLVRDATDIDQAIRIGLPRDPQDRDQLRIKITFDETGSVQNEFQGDAAKFQFVFEATQWDGVEVGPQDANGEINNDLTESSNSGNQPDPITEGDSGNGITDIVDEGGDNPEE